MSQKTDLLAMGWTEDELRINQWRPKPWTDIDDARHERQMDENVRDFLRCPNSTCRSVGCFKPRYNPEYKHPRYYVCKWCGYGRNFDGEWQYWPDPVGHHWGIRTANSTPTPKELCGNLDPWVG